MLRYCKNGHSEEIDPDKDKPDIYYDLNKFGYTRDEMMWAISVILPLNAGDWAVKHTITGYIGKSKSAVHSAPFEGAGLVRAEIEDRLKWAKKDGELLADKLWSGIELYDELPQEAKNALNYISSGVKRRDVCYYMWLFIRKYTVKGDKCKCGNRTWRMIAGGTAKSCFKCGRVVILKSSTKYLQNLSRV